MNLHRLLTLGLCILAASPAPAAPRTDLLGDRLPAGAIARMGSGRLRASSTVTALAFTPDRKHLVSAGHGNKLQFWSVAGGAMEKEWTVGPYSVFALQFSADGKTAAASCNDGTVRILDGGSGEERRQLMDPLRRYGNASISLSADGRWLVMNQRYDRQLLVFDVENGALKHRHANINTYALPQIAITPDSKRMVTLWSDGKLHLVDLAGGKSVRPLETEVVGLPSPYSPQITSMALSGDGKKLIYRGYSDRHFHIIDVATGKRDRKFERSGPYSYSQTGSMALTPNNRFFVECGGDSSARLWGIASGKMLREFTVPNAAVNSLTLSSDGKLVATAHGTAIYLWDVASGKQVHGNGGGHAYAVTGLAFTPGGKTLISVGNVSMRAWDATTGKEAGAGLTGVYGAGLRYLRVGNDNRTVHWAGVDRGLFRWRFGDDKEAVRLTVPKSTLPPLQSYAVSPDGKLLAGFTQGDRKVVLIDNLGNAADRDLGVLPQNVYPTGFQFSPDGRTLALAATDRTVTLFDVASGTESRKLLADPTMTPGHYGTLIQFSSDGRTLLKYDGELRIVEAATGGDRSVLARQAAGAPTVMACSEDGRLVARGFGDGAVVVHDAWTGREVVRRQTGQGSVTALAFSHDGRRLATGGANTTAMVWEVPTPGRPERVSGLTDEDAWADLEDGDASRAHRAMTHLLASPEATARLFKERLKPRRPTGPRRIARLVADLDDDDYKVRERANDELLAIGMAAEPALRKAARSSSAELKRRAEALLERLRPGTSVSPDRLRAQRAVEVLERLGTPAARAVLEALLRSRLDPALEHSVKGSLARLGATG